MIKFFRKIRLKLLSENKFSKYLIYAIGEIVLVVIGILIALKINNWNIENKNSSIEIKYVQGIINDVSTDIVSLEYGIERDKLKLESLTYLVKSFQDENLRKDLELMKMSCFYAFDISDFNGQWNFFEQIKNTGNLNLIKNDSVLKLIQNYYTKGFWLMETIKTNNKKMEDVSLKGMLPYVDANSVSQVVFPKEYKIELNPFDTNFFEKGIKDEKVIEFVNALDYTKVILIFNYNGQIDYLKDAQYLKAELNKELKSLKGI